MNTASEELEFEKAIEYRELINSIKKVSQKQKNHGQQRGRTEIFLLWLQKKETQWYRCFCPRRAADRREHFYLRISKGEEHRSILDSFIKQYYAGTPFIPGELMLPEEIEDKELIEEWLGKKRGQKLVIRVPKEGVKKKSWWNWRQTMQDLFWIKIRKD